MSSTSARRGPPRPSWRAARRQRMLAAAVDALRGRPMERVSMDDFARAAAVGKATLYRYFPTKDALLCACLETVVDELGARMERAEASEDAPPERLRAIVRVMVDGFSDHLLPLRLLAQRQAGLQEGWRQSVQDARRRLVTVLRSHFDRGAQAGDYAQLDGELVAHLIMGMIRSGVTHATGLSNEALTDAICGVVLRGCGAARRDARRPRGRQGGDGGLRRHDRAALAAAGSGGEPNVAS